MVGCNGGAPAGSVGTACDAMHSCTTPLQCVPDLPGGYCTADCSQNACPGGATCGVVGGASICLRPCSQQGDCRSGYQCFQNACVPNCRSDGDCGAGFQCGGDGKCAPFSGNPVGASCTSDMDCSTRTCLLGTCAQPCTHDAACPSNQTCALSIVGDGTAASPTTRIVEACTARRSSMAPGSACTSDGDCDRGSCQLGACVELCATTPDCHGTSMSCDSIPVLFDNSMQGHYKGCLPQAGMLSFDGAAGVAPLPDRAQSFAIYSFVQPYSFTDFVGVTELLDPTGATLFTPAMDTAGFYMLKIRYQPTESSSTMLVPNSPAVTLAPNGVYQFVVSASTLGTENSRVFVKLAPSPPMTGSLPLNFYLPNLAGACKDITTSNAQQTLANAVAIMGQIYGQAGITFSTVTYNATSASNTIKVQTAATGMPLPDLDDVLRTATANQPTTPGLDVVILRAIEDQNGNQSNILGVAGGIPGSPVLGTAHSGAVVWVATLCQAQGDQLFAATASHEVGHTLGLFHNIEQDGHTDPLTDTNADGMNNLMFWQEGGGEHLTVQQGQVIRADPKVQ